MSLVVERTPIDLSTLPETLHKHLDPSAPAPLKLMAARGMLPIPPAQNVRVLYMLAIGTDQATATEATKSFDDLPAEILLPVLPAENHVGILDWIAERRKDDARALEAVVMNRATSDVTVARVARHGDAAMCEIIATNQVRVLQAPTILEQMYQNPKARMATVDRLLELVQREGIELQGLPAVQQALNSGQKIFSDEENSDADAVLVNEARRAEEEEERLKNLDNLPRSEREKQLAEDEEKVERGSSMLSGQISRMSISEKVRLGTVGSREALNLLVRDPNKLVHMAAVRSPRAQDIDYRRWARNKTLPDGVITFIAGQRDLTRHYDVLLALCQNPKTPLTNTLKFLNHVRTNDLKQLAKDRNISMQVARQAKQLYAKRSTGQK